jgi:heme-degrading monooxygenase HmoA
MDEYVVWITTRRIKPGAYEDFRRAWRPTEFPDGMIRAYECFAEDRNEVVGISVWESNEAREAFRRSDVESGRRRVMSPFVVEETSGVYVGRELTIPRPAASPSA